jgi:hypothetical protein
MAFSRENKASNEKRPTIAGRTPEACQRITPIAPVLLVAVRAVVAIDCQVQAATDGNGSKGDDD